MLWPITTTRRATRTSSLRQIPPQADEACVVLRVLRGAAADHVDRLGRGSAIARADVVLPEFGADEIDARDLLADQIRVFDGQRRPALNLAPVLVPVVVEAPGGPLLRLKRPRSQDTELAPPSGSRTTDTPVITEMIAATPAMMPTRVRADRSLWALIDARAILNDSTRSLMVAPSCQLSAAGSQVRRSALEADRSTADN